MMRNRGFEKVSKSEFSKYFNDLRYPEVIMPVRKTKNSAGYDFHLVDDIVLPVKEVVMIPTGIKAYMNEDEFLMIVIRSSLGIKYGLQLVNQNGIIDSDYYDNIDNEGHIFIAIKNEGKEEVKLSKNDAFAQGIFLRYLIVDDEKEPQLKRLGGIGSTGL